MLASIIQEGSITASITNYRSAKLMFTKITALNATSIKVQSLLSEPNDVQC